MPAINGQKPGRYRTGLGPTDDIPRDLIETLPLSIKGQHLLRLPRHFDHI